MNDPKTGGVVSYKNKNYIIVSSCSRLKDPETGEWVDCVIYKPLYDSPYEMFAREINQFTEQFESNPGRVLSFGNGDLFSMKYPGIHNDTIYTVDTFSVNIYDNFLILTMIVRNDELSYALRDFKFDSIILSITDGTGTIIEKIIFYDPEFEIIKDTDDYLIRYMVKFSKTETEKI